MAELLNQDFFINPQNKSNSFMDLIGFRLHFFQSLLALLLSSLFIVGCHRKGNINFVKKVSSPMDSLVVPFDHSKSSKITYINSSDGVLSVWHKIEGGPNFFNVKTMLESVIDSTMSETEKAFALWHFVSENGFHYSYPYNHKLMDNLDPISLVTFPYFLCGEKSGILANLAHQAGLKTRVITMDGHIVTEIFCNGSWSMFDADENVVFVTSSNKPYSVAQLSARPRLICEENVIKSVDDKFTGFKHYRTYLKGYSPNSKWISNYFLIKKYLKRSMGLKLFPLDSISFELNESSFLKRFLNKRYLFETQGFIYRHIHASQLKIQNENKSDYLFEDTIPFYIKSIVIAKRLGTSIKAYLTVQNRVTERWDTVAAGNIGGKEVIKATFNAPSDSCINYSYRLGIKNCDSTEIGRIGIRIEFEFNQLVFPYSKAKTIVVNKEGEGVLVIQAEGYQ